MRWRLERKKKRKKKRGVRSIVLWGSMPHGRMEERHLLADKAWLPALCHLPMCRLLLDCTGRGRVRRETAQTCAGKPGVGEDGQSAGTAGAEEEVSNWV